MVYTRGVTRRKPKVISLFSGAGGFEHGFVAAGFQSVLAVEMDHDACVTLRRSYPRVRVIEDDILGVKPASLTRLAGLRKRHADVVMGGPPCQPFSKSGYWVTGQSAGLRDPRAGTLGAYFDAVEAVLPRVFVLENVPGVAYQSKRETFEYILGRIEGINQRAGTSYRPEAAVLRVAEHGVPQLRERFFLVAARNGQGFRFPVPTHGDKRTERHANGSACNLEPFHTAWDALGDLPDPSNAEDLQVRGKWADLLPSIPEGRNYLHHTKRGSGVDIFGWRRRYWSFLLKLAKTKPSWTLQASPGPGCGPFHWSNRRLSVRELCRIQTFPDWVDVYGSQASIQRQIGNAVPSLMAEILAREIGSQLLGLPRPLGPPTLLPVRRGPPPPPDPPRRPPKRYDTLRGRDTPHPGHGLGRRASQR